MFRFCIFSLTAHVVPQIQNVFSTNLNLKVLFVRARQIIMRHPTSSLFGELGMTHKNPLSLQTAPLKKECLYFMQNSNHNLNVFLHPNVRMSPNSNRSPKVKHLRTTFIFLTLHSCPTGASGSNVWAHADTRTHACTHTRTRTRTHTGVAFQCDESADAASPHSACSGWRQEPSAARGVEIGQSRSGALRGKPAWGAGGWQTAAEELGRATRRLPKRSCWLKHQPRNPSEPF